MEEKTINVFGVEFIVEHEDNEIQKVKVKDLVDVYELLIDSVITRIKEEL